MTAHKPHKDKTMAQQAAIAQKPTKAQITLSRPLKYDTILKLEDKIQELRLQNFTWERTVLRQADEIKDLRNQLLSLK